jgi:restriction system protein
VREDHTMQAGPKFLRFFVPIVQTLREAGGESSAREVIDRAKELAGTTDDEQAERTSSGVLRLDNQINWARKYLVWAGLLDGSTRGRWALTSEGWGLDLQTFGHDAAYALFKQVRLERQGEWGQVTEDSGDVAVEDSRVDAIEDAPGEDTLITELRSTILSLPPGGFENLCKRVLGRLGLAQLRTVGQAGDRGIDVEGLLRVSSVITFRVGVQCKLYSDGNKVTPRQIREFQGALGPFDRGIFMTTSVFTQQAEEQASAPGYKPIDLIDGERLIELMMDLRAGIKEITVVDEAFFSPFL